MRGGRFVAYYRVSTHKQGQSGLGLEAQQDAVKHYLQGEDRKLVAEYIEVETGKGAAPLAKRPQLREALDACRTLGAVLVIAKLDRLARNVHFVSGLMESKVKFVACDMPEANELTIHIMAAFAEHEAKRISQRTKDALAIAKARGIRLGTAGASNLKPNIELRRAAAMKFAENLRNVIRGFQAAGLSARQMVCQLNQLEIRTIRGGSWSLVQLQRLMVKLEDVQLGS